MFTCITHGWSSEIGMCPMCTVTTTYGRDPNVFQRTSQQAVCSNLEHSGECECFGGEASSAVRDAEVRAWNEARLVVIEVREQNNKHGGSFQSIRWDEADNCEIALRAAMDEHGIPITANPAKEPKS